MAKDCRRAGMHTFTLALVLAMIFSESNMNFMTEISPICSATAEVCPAKQVLIDALRYDDVTLRVDESELGLQSIDGVVTAKHSLIANKILQEANANCFGDDECWVVRGLVRALFTQS